MNFTLLMSGGNIAKGDFCALLVFVHPNLLDVENQVLVFAW